MEKIDKKDLKKLYKPPKTSHKGENGKLTIIGGSHLFHGASLWALKIASRIVDMVYYSSIPAKQSGAVVASLRIHDTDCVPRDKIESYIEESDAVLIGPGLMRTSKTKRLTKKLLFKFPTKKWILDAGSLQMMEKDLLKKLSQVIITPHKKEFVRLFNTQSDPGKLASLAKEYGCVIGLKGQTDYVCSPAECAYNTTGNEGMTKGGTGDVLAGLIAALACKNELFLAGCAGVYVNGLAGDRLYKHIGPFYNASDLCDEVPKVLK